MTLRLPKLMLSFVISLMLINQAARADEVIEWNKILIDAIRTDRTPPPKASRAMAMVHTAMYDAINAIIATHEPYLLTQRAPADASQVAAAAVAAEKVLSQVFPNQRSRFTQQLNQTLGSIPDGSNKTAGINIGQAAAELIIRARGNDDGTQAPGAAPALTAGVWEPTPPDFAPYLLAGWGTVKPWTMRSASQFRRPGPPKLQTGKYTHAFNETKALGEKNSTQRTADQTQIAKFWADGPGTATPPGHWNVIARDLSAGRRLSLPENARLFALLNLALADAAIAAWDMKFTYYSWRPITAIRNADSDGNDRTEADRSWEPLIPTPPFPDYVSGHSTFSDAGSEILQLYFGSDRISFTSRSDDLPGVVRSYSRLSEAAEEAGRSRVYGGIHFDFADTDGLKAGRQLAKQVFQHHLRPQRP